MLPPLLVEVSLGIAAAGIAVAARAALGPQMGGAAPYALVYVAVAIAAVAGGWRSGLTAMAAGQLLTWYAVLPWVHEPAVTQHEAAAGLIVATSAQAILLTVIALYQREVDKGAAAREERVALLDEALKEIDHRTRNNYQVVLALVDLQSRRSTDASVRQALRQVSDRIQAIADASNQLAVRSADLDAIRLDDHLCGLVEHIERGLSREEIAVECDVDEAITSPDKATSISIIVNELVTNAIKHAFNGAGSGHVRVTGRRGEGFELIVADNGRGMDAARKNGGSGLGTKLVESFARQLGAKHQVSSSDKGTTHRLLIPTLD